MATIKCKQDSSEDILEKVFSYAEKMESESKNKLKIHFWGSQHFDSEFDKKSGKLQVGVLAKDPQAALTMMVILQFGEEFQEWLDFDDDIVEVTVEDAIKKLGASSDGFRLSFGINEIYKNTYYTRTCVDGKLTYINRKVETTFQDVEVYNFQRIKEDYMG